MSLGEMFHDGGGDALVRCTILSTPSAVTDDVDVLIDFENGSVTRTVAGWSPKPGSGGTVLYPQTGGEGLCGMDGDSGEAWLLMWTS
jgi:hypothetical protein